MPHIPQIPLQAQPTGPIPLHHPGYAANTAAVGEGLAQLGQTLGHIGGVLKDAYDESEAQKAQTDAQAQLQQFTFQLHNGSQAEDGTPIAPPDPTKHLELYQKEVERINSVAESKLSGRALRMFQENFTPFADRQQLVVQENANETVKDRIRAQSQVTLQGMAQRYVDADPLTRPKIEAEMNAHVQNLEGYGVINPLQAGQLKKQFLVDSEEGAFYKIMKSNPSDAIAAIDKGEFNVLPVDRQQALRNRAINEDYTQTMRKNAETARLDAVERRNQTKTEQSTAKDLIEKQSQGNLHPRDVIANKENLSVEMFSRLLKETTGRVETPSNRHVFAQLVLKASHGLDVRGDVLKAFENQQLSISDTKSVFAMAERNSAGAALSNLYKQGVTYIDKAVKVPAMYSTPADATRLANAHLAWMKYASAHPDMTQDQAEKEYKATANDARLAKIDQMAISVLTPRFWKGSGIPTREDMQQAARDTEAAFKAGQIDKFVYDREKEKVIQLLSILPPDEPKKEKK